MRRLILSLLLCSGMAHAGQVKNPVNAPIGGIAPGHIYTATSSSQQSGDGGLIAPAATIDTTNAANISSGTLPSGRLPVVSGDVTTPVGSAVTTLKNTGTAGTYTKVTTDAQGRVSGGTALGSSDVTTALGFTPLSPSSWAAPGAIGSTTPSTGAFTTLSATGQITSTIGTGTAPFSVASTTLVPNLNASLLSGTSVGTSGSTLCVLSGNCSVSGTWTYSTSPALTNGTFVHFTDTLGSVNSGIGITAGNVFQINATVGGGGTGTILSTPADTTNGLVTFARQVLVQSGARPTTSLSPEFRVQIGSASGTVTTGTSPSYAAITTNSDNTVTTGTGAPGGINLLNLGMTIGGPLMTGNRTALVPSVTLSATSANAASGGKYYYTAVQPLATSSVNDGGTSLGAAYGSMVASNPYVELKSGATFWSGIAGEEIDIGADSGTSLNYKVGLHIAQLATDQQSGAAMDTAFGIEIQPNGTAPGWDTVFSVGSRLGWWPVKSTGTIIGTYPATIGGGPSMAAANGTDWSAVTFSGCAYKSTGYCVDGSGNTKVLTEQTTQVYTVSGLPTCNSTSKGMRTAVSDANAPTFLGTLAGGGSVISPAFCNGTNWVAG